MQLEKKNNKLINIREEFTLIKNKIATIKPIILCLTNFVSVNDVVNAISYAEAIPVVSNDFCDAKKILVHANCLLINIGTINKTQLHLIKKIYYWAKKLNKLIVVDPVGYGISPIRTKIIDKILNDNYDKVIIKGNQTEISKIINKNIVVKSVNNSLTLPSITNLKNLVCKVSTKYKKIICLSGKINVCGYLNNFYIINNGNEHMSLISGTGCILTSLIALFSSISKDKLKAAALATLLMSLSGEIAFQNKGLNLATYKIKILDNINWLLNNIDIINRHERILYDEC